MPGEPIYCYCVTLRVWGNLSYPEDLSHRLGLTLEHVHREGERCDFAAQETCYREDMWVYQVPVDQHRPLEEHLQALHDALRPHADYLKALQQSVRVEVFGGYVNATGVTFKVSPKCLQLLAQLAASLQMHFVMNFTMP